LVTRGRLQALQSVPTLATKARWVRDTQRESV